MKLGRRRIRAFELVPDRELAHGSPGEHCAILV
jgi:hypothetical protein